MNEDTIVTLSTAPVNSAIAVIRVSGDNALNIANSIFSRHKKLKPRYMTYGNILDEDGVLDEVMVCYLPSPHTYTREDILEIYCHGNMVLVDSVISLILKKGARLAEKGEFTKRAFMNGRIDLTQAESVLNIINSKSSKSLDNSLKNLDGFIKKEVEFIRSNIIDSMSEINVVSDYPEEVEDKFSSKSKIVDCILKIDSLVSSYENGKRMKDGVKVALIGKPNVGKSSIMNRLIRNDKAIVTDIAGTTRDVIEDTFYINGAPFVILDTAGIRDSSDRVESIGIDLSKKAAKEADLVLFITDASNPIEKEDLEILELLKDSLSVTVMNKCDLEIKNQLNVDIKISAKNSELYELEEAIYKKCYGIKSNEHSYFLDNTRQKALFVKVKSSLSLFLEDSSPLDIRSIHLQNALDYLGEIIGEISTEDLLDNIFSSFCVGK